MSRDRAPAVHDSQIGEGVGRVARDILHGSRQVQDRQRDGALVIQLGDGDGLGDERGNHDRHIPGRGVRAVAHRILHGDHTGERRVRRGVREGPGRRVEVTDRAVAGRDDRVGEGIRWVCVDVMDAIQQAGNGRRRDRRSRARRVPQATGSAAIGPMSISTVELLVPVPSVTW